ncbi:PKD domain-containing protein [uncultured Pontibacter sp.]|uniref:PKD domain-containing protein n=1 Tax=uncultured Pontibacter sp. TaxID=453356 RepID=UPI0026163A4F|nr:PKD domain-containing protein [uncultured Pontibacter sp.]
MKLYRLFFLMIMLFTAVSCDKDDITTIAPDGEFLANFDFPEGPIYAPAKVVLTNRSKYGESFEWEFPGGKALTADGIQDVSKSTGVVPDTIVYELPGTYKVRVIAKQGGTVDSLTKTVEVLKLQPRIIVPENILFRQDVEFSAEVFQYPGQAVTYEWDFGNGVVSTEARPTVVFEDAGTYTVTLTINDGQETITTTAAAVVKGELVKTIYFTDVRTGRLYKQRFTQAQESQPMQLPVNIGQHPLGVSVYNNRVVMSNAGANVSFAAAGAADGRVFTTDLNGQDEYTITSGTGDYQNDPFSSSVDQNGNVWWVTRRNGVFSAPIASREAPYPAAKFTLAAAHAGATSVFGWLDGYVQVADGVVWYSKHGSAGRGLYKFNTAGQFIESITPLQDVRLRSFAIDTQNGKIYFAVNFAGGGLNKGLYVSNIDGTNIQLIDDLAGFSEQGGANEQTYVTDMALDTNPDDGSAGYLYYGFRDASDVSASGVVVGDGSNSGVKRYPLNGGSAEFFVKGFIPYGIAIDHVRR